jgi:hypothetical protein
MPALCCCCATRPPAQCIVPPLPPSQPVCSTRAPRGWGRAAPTANAAGRQCTAAAEAARLAAVPAEAGPAGGAVDATAAATALDSTRPGQPQCVKRRKCRTRSLTVCSQHEQQHAALRALAQREAWVAAVAPHHPARFWWRRVGGWSESRV